MKKLLLIAAAVLAGASGLRAEEYTAISPDGKITVTVSTAPELRWSVTREGERLLDASRIGMKIAGAEPFGAAPVVRRAERRRIDERSTAPVPTKFRTLHDRCEELLLTFRGGWAVRFRVYDNGAVYRFETARKGTVDIESETAELNFAADFETLWPREENPDFISHCEAFFDRKHLSELDAKRYAYLPVWFSSPRGTRMVVTETDLEDYPCLFLFGGEGHSLRAQFPPVVLEARLREGSDRNEELVKKAPYIARTRGTRTFPWRVVTIDPDDRALLENNLAYQLASKPVEGDASWVRPGKISWEWWHSLNIYGVDFRSGVNTATYKYYIDFAAKYGIDYILLDEGWSVSTLNIKEPRREIYRDWGVKGIKIDFMQRSDQEMVRFYDEIARAAFDRGLIVDFHGSFKPAGLQRKYPNVLSFEGVYGMEHDKCSTDISPVHDCTLPFTRMVAGPMDYTPGATRNATRADFAISWDNPMSQGTRAHQASLYVGFESALQMLCDSPSHYLREAEFTAFIAAVPTVWDETVGLAASVGEYAAVARRSGEKWYIGAITDWTARTLEAPLKFLDGGRYRMKVFADGVNADRIARDYRTETREVTRDDAIALRMAPGGGWAAVLEPVK